MSLAPDNLDTLCLRLALHEAQLEAALDGVLLVDPAGTVVHYNRRFAELWGLPEALLASRDDQAIMRHVLPLMADPRAFVRGVEALYAEPERIACDELLLGDGRVYERYTAPAIGKDGYCFGRIWFFRDITELRRAREYTERLQALNEELRAKQEELERLTRMKDEFLGVVSHELRTPLTVIKSAAAILLKGKAGQQNEAQAQFSAVIMEHAGRLGRLVDDILSFQKIEGGKQEAELREGDVNAAALEVAEGFAVVLAERGQSLDLALAEAPLPARFDPQLLGQVLLNLLSNAAKFSPEGGRIVLSTRADGDEVRIAVADEGCGVDEADRERIFEKFVQIRDGQGGKPGGTGLGLPICKRLVEEVHGGRIWVEGRPEGGSVFTIALPVAPGRAGGGF